jgi:hypothetical protein
MATSEELRGYTIEKLRELCAERHIAIHAKKKEELITALMEVVPETKGPGAQGGAPIGPSTGELFELILRMQRDQMAWMQGQQQRQEEWMQAQQGCQRELMERMREQQERGCIAAEEARRAAKFPKPLLQKFTEKDDVESYLDMFERVASQQEWPKETWATQLAGLLSGDALDSYSAFAPASAKDYDSVKAAILKRYDVSAETYRQRFRLETRKPTESYHNFGERVSDLLGRWERAAEETELRELVLLEQFLQALPKDMAVRVREEKPKTIKEASEMADSYELARKADGGGAAQQEQQQQGLDQTSNVGSGAPAGKARSQGPLPRTSPGVQRSKTNSRGDILCWECGRYGHIAVSCPNRKAPDDESISTDGYSTSGQHAGTKKRTTGSEMSIARASLVDPAKWSQETVRVRCIHGDDISYPSAIVNLNLDGWERSIKVALAPHTPVDVVLRHDDPSTMARKSLMATTRAQERRQLQEEQREKTNDEVEANPMSADTLSADGQQPCVQSSEMERREGNDPVSECLDLQEPNSPKIRVENGAAAQPEKEYTPMDPQMHTLSDDVLQATPLQLRDWQQTDPTLQKVRELASSSQRHVGQGKTTFFYRGGLIYRRWSPTLGENQDVLSVNQLVLPQQCQQRVLNVAHNVPMAGHLGTNKTKARILKYYYWPGVFKQVANHCKTCKVCQRAGEEHPVACASRKLKPKENRSSSLRSNIGSAANAIVTKALTSN